VDVTYTNSSLSTARRCLERYRLQYLERLELDSTLPEALAVGQVWHDAQEATVKGEDPFALIERTSPSELWSERLRQLHAAHSWYWMNQAADYEVVEAEAEFEVEIAGATFRGKVDGVLRDAHGRRGILEYKTTAESIAGASPYWRRLNLDAQIGIYGLAFDRPDFILYDVTHKPTTKPKAILKKELARMRREVEKRGVAVYYGIEFGALDLDTEAALDRGEESLRMYGARLRSTIADDPSRYFGRREVARTTADYDSLVKDLESQVALMDHIASESSLDGYAGYHRNPDACHALGTCPFFNLCTSNRYVEPGVAPQGYRIRSKLHPELS